MPTNAPTSNKKHKVQMVFFPTWGRKHEPSSTETVLPSITLSTEQQEAELKPHRSWIKLVLVILVVLVVIRVFQSTESYWLTIGLSLVAVMFYKRRKITDTIGEAVKASQDKRGKTVTGIVLGEIFTRILIYTIGLAFVVAIFASATCGIQNSLHLKVFSKQFCQRSDINWVNFFNNSRNNGY